MFVITVFHVELCLMFWLHNKQRVNERKISADIHIYCKGEKRKGKRNG